MTAIELLISQPAAQAIAWALLQFVWQGALVGLLTAIALFALRASASDVRYVVATIGLSLMLTMPAVTAVQTWRSLQENAAFAIAPDASLVGDARSDRATSNLPGTRGQVAGVGGDLIVQGRASTGSRASVTPPAMRDANAAAQGRPFDVAQSRPGWLMLLLFVWVGGVTLLTLRLLVGWFCVRTLKTRGTSAISAEWHATLTKLSRQLHIARRIRLLQSTLVDVPTVIGWLRPVVLMPASTLAGMAPQQLEAILAHELAHIRRHDYLVNLLQTLVETLLFYHPAVWWVSRRIRMEREHCCDDLAVSLCGDPVAYARALADLEALRADSTGLVLAANGGSLLHRVRRLLGTPSHAGRGPGWLAATAAIFLISGIAIGSLGRGVLDAEQRSSRDHRSDLFRSLREIEAKRIARLQWEPARMTRAGIAPLPETPVELSEQRSRRDNTRTQDARAAVHAIRDTVRDTLRDSVRGSFRTFREVVRGVVMEARAEYPQWLAPIPPVPPTPPVPPEPPSPPVPPSSPEPPAPPTPPAPPEPPPSFEVEAMTPPAPPLPPMPPSAPMPPAPPAAPMPPAPPAPPAPPVGFQEQSRGTSTWSWSNGSEKLEIKRHGDVTFTDDDTDVKSISPGGYLTIKDGGWITSRSVEFDAGSDGTIRRRYWEGWSEKPFEPAGRLWLAQELPRIIRRTGIGAPARVARILKAKGTPGVLAEIGLIEGSWGKRLYFTELLKATTLDAQTARQVLAQAGREIDSDYELATFLMFASDRLPADDAMRAAFFEASKTINSDFEMRRLFSHIVEKGAQSPSTLAMMLDTSTAIDSDFEEATLLIAIAKQQALDNRTREPFFRALATVSSDFEHKRVLTAIAARGDLTAENAAPMLESTIKIGSDFEKATSLLAIVKTQPIEGPVRAPFFRAAESINSAFERGRVLQEVAKQEKLSSETILGVVRAARTMSSNFETSQVLTTLAANHPISGEARDIYIEAAGKLGNFEEGRALTALVKAERRK
jgi:beta-lactamase regulating signal transducer with metallopeptidase domain